MELLPLDLTIKTVFVTITVAATPLELGIIVGGGAAAEIGYLIII
ncbi:3910_t:CDS:1, partial [Gigaspora rosea]